MKYTQCICTAALAKGKDIGYNFINKILLLKGAKSLWLL